ncbi:MAG: DUF3857 domain-containing protein [Bacteroidia bacterium]
MNTFNSLKRLALLLGLMILIAFSAFSQEKIKFGKVSDEDVMMKTYEADPDAPAVVLSHSRSCSIEKYGSTLKMVYFYNKRIKILSEQGLDYANVKVRFIGQRHIEKVTGIKGITYSYDESTKEVVQHKLEKEDIFTEENEAYWHFKKFSMPQVSVGDVIEYKYQYITEDLSVLEHWNFQEDIPVILSQVSLNTPREYEYKRIFSGIRLPVQEEAETQSQTWTARNVEALKTEPYVASMENYRSGMDWKLTSLNVPGVTFREYNRDFSYLATDLSEQTAYGRALKNNTSWDYTLKSLVPGEGKSPEVRIASLMSALGMKIKWNEKLGAFPLPGMIDVLRKNESNGAGLNLLLVRGIRMMGYDAYPVMISTRKNGLVNPFFPISGQFNHCIVQAYLPNDTLLLDMTHGAVPYNILPVKDLNGVGLVLKEKTYGWVELTPEEKMEKGVKASFKIDAEGNAVGKITYTDKGYRAAIMRARYQDKEGTDKDFVQKQWLDDAQDCEVTSVELTNTKDHEKPFVTKVEFESTGYCNAVGDRLYIKPMLWEAKVENMFKEAERELPIDLAVPHKYRYMGMITLPEGFKIEETPKPIIQVIPGKGAVFKYQVMAMGGMVQVLYDFEFKNAQYEAELYPYLRAFMDEIIAKHAEQIVAVKKD